MTRILVVDDEEDMRMALTNTLELKGYEVLRAENGPKALAAVAAQAVDLVLLDMRLPGMDGVQILRRLKTERPGLPVIMVTGYGNVDSAIQTMKLGAADYVSKPFENKDLFARIEKALGNAEAAEAPGPLTQRLMQKLQGGAEEVEEDVERAPATVVVHEAASGWGRWLGGLAAGLVLAGGAWWWINRPAVTLFTAPGTYISGIAWDGGHLWLSDWFMQTLFECKLDGEKLVIHKSYRLAQTNPSGIAWSDDALYVSDAWKRRISKHELDASLTERTRADGPGPAPSGLHWDGENLWSVDLETAKVYRHGRSAKLPVERAFDSASSKPKAVVARDGLIWVADASTRRVYRYRDGDSVKLDGVFTHPVLSEEGRPLSAFTIVGTQAWFGFENSNKLYRLPLTKLRRIVE